MFITLCRLATLRDISMAALSIRIVFWYDLYRAGSLSHLRIPFLYHLAAYAWGPGLSDHGHIYCNCIVPTKLSNEYLQTVESYWSSYDNRDTCRYNSPYWSSKLNILESQLSRCDLLPLFLLALSRLKRHHVIKISPMTIVIAKPGNKKITLADSMSAWKQRDVFLHLKRFT